MQLTCWSSCDFIHNRFEQMKRENFHEGSWQGNWICQLKKFNWCELFDISFVFKFVISHALFIKYLVLMLFPSYLWNAPWSRWGVSRWWDEVWTFWRWNFWFVVVVSESFVHQFCEECFTYRRKTRILFILCSLRSIPFCIDDSLMIL